MSTEIKAGIYYSLDFYTAMFYNNSIADVLSFIKLDDKKLIDDVFANVKTHILCCSGTKFVYKYNDIWIQVPYGEILKIKDFETDPKTVFYTKFSELRLEIKGQGLDWLRSYHKDKLDIDEHLRFAKPLRGDYRVSRIDFAFDLINTHSDFLSKVMAFLKDRDARGHERLEIMGLKSGCAYSFKGGDQSTAYLGRTGSDCFLRVYDKKRQLCKDGVWRSPCKYGDNVGSWIRLEMQTRDDYTNDIWTAVPDEVENTKENFALATFRWIYHRFRFRDPDVPRHRPEPMKFWEDLFSDWDKIAQLIRQNAKKAVNSITYGAKVTKYVNGVAFAPRICNKAMTGLQENFIDGDHLLKIQREARDPNDPNHFVSSMQWNSLIDKLKQCAGDDSLLSLPGIYKDDQDYIHLKGDHNYIFDAFITILKKYDTGVNFTLPYEVLDLFADIEYLNKLLEA